MTIEKTIVFMKAILEKLNSADGEWVMQITLSSKYIVAFFLLII